METDGEIEVKMSILTVQKLSHGFGDRAIFDDVNFRLLKGEHIGFVGANGEGKSTFMKIITNISVKTDLRHSLHMVEHIRTIKAIMI